jgi:hypothetical protein
MIGDVVEKRSWFVIRFSGAVPAARQRGIAPSFSVSLCLRGENLAQLRARGPFVRTSTWSGALRKPSPWPRAAMEPKWTSAKRTAAHWLANAPDIFHESSVSACSSILTMANHGPSSPLADFHAAVNNRRNG